MSTTRLAPLSVNGYVLGDQLGSGAMGAVYLGHRESDGLPVAIKIIHPEHAFNPRHVARFLSEARLIARIDHEHVVKLHACTEAAPGRCALVMELVEGESLRSVLHRRGLLPFADAARIAAKVALGVAAAHAEGIVHRDLKPDNVMLDAGDDDGGGGLVKVLDFGVAKLVSEGAQSRLTLTGTLIGTPDYMAPEMIASPKEVGPPADVYALGCMLFEMCTGMRPFAGDGYALLARQLHDAPPAPRTLNAFIPEWLDAIILRAMSKEPGDRFAMFEMAVALLGPEAVTRPGRASHADAPPSSPVALHAAPTEIGASRDLYSAQTRQLSAATITAPLPVVRSHPGLGFAGAISQTHTAVEPTEIVSPLWRVLGKLGAHRERRIVAWAGAALLAAIASGLVVARALDRPDPTLSFTIDTQPSGAVVYDRGVRLGTTPLVALGWRATTLHELRFEKEGYGSLSVTMARPTNARILFWLTPERAAAPALAPAPAEAERPAGDAATRGKRLTAPAAIAPKLQPGTRKGAKPARSPSDDALLDIDF
jgi:eukaryotic-like serine/threonine-protein kinase